MFFLIKAYRIYINFDLLMLSSNFAAHITLGMPKVDVKMVNVGQVT